MFAKAKGLMACVTGHHLRSEADARKIDDTYVSVCQHCGVGLRRLSKRHWVVARPRRWRLPER